MVVTFIKEPHNRYSSTAHRKDGVLLYVPGYDRKFDLPHDYCHFIVEKGFNLEWGFWGCISKGAIFDGMKVLSGRQRPHSAAASKQILKKADDNLTEAEAVVSAMYTIYLKGMQWEWSRAKSEVLYNRYTSISLSSEKVRDVCDEIDRALHRWKPLNVGESITGESITGEWDVKQTQVERIPLRVVGAYRFYTSNQNTNVNVVGPPGWD